MNNPTGQPNLTFQDLRLRMSSLGRFFVRLAAFSTYGVMVAATITFLLSDLSLLKSIGWILLLFLGDRVLHIGKGDRPLTDLPKSGKINAARYAAPAALLIMERAYERALLRGGDFGLHILDQLMGKRELRPAFIRMDIDLAAFQAKLDEHLQRSEASTQNTKDSLQKEASALMAHAFAGALHARSAFIEPRDLLAALGAGGGRNVNALFALFAIEGSDWEHAVIFTRMAKKLWGLRRLPSTLTGFIGRPYKVRHRAMNRAWTARPTAVLDQYSDDLTDLARSETIGLLVGHETEYDRLLDVLSRPGRPNALLVGDPGTGKEAVIAHLAYQITKDRVPPPLFDKRLIKLDISRVVAGAQADEVQKRIQTILEEIMRAGNIVLYVPDIHNVMKTSVPGSLNIADALVPALRSETFSVVGTTYPREFKDYLEHNTDFVSAFEVINVQEISEHDAMTFLVYSSIILERQYRITISFRAIKEAVRLARQYFRPRLLPASAEDLLKETLADAVEKGKKIIYTDDVIAVAEKKVNVPLHRATEKEAETLLNLEAAIHERLINQEEAVQSVSRALREYRSGLARKGGPIATFLFVGPTGVGKTELAKILASLQFGSEDAMARFDMSEYQDKTAVNRLLDSVTGAAREKPYSLVLLDEFEKAHPDILNIFLQMFDDGRLTDTENRTIDFQNTIIIATSNAHSGMIKRELDAGKTMAAIGEEIKKKLTEYFRPELLNRFSGIVVFRSLNPEEIGMIARLHLQALSDQLKETHGIEVIFEESAVNAVAEKGYDPAFGARPLRKVISDTIKAVLAEKILKNEITRGSVITVTFDGNLFRFAA